MADTFGIQAAGVVGIAIEATASSYQAPQKYLPLIDESLVTTEDNQYRELITGVVDPWDVKAGNEAHEGTINMEVLHDCFPYFMHAMRGEVTKTGNAPNFVYTVAPTHVGSRPENFSTLSITIIRNDEVFTYAGCVVGSISITQNNGILVAAISLMGADEAAGPTPSGVTIPTTDPFGMGEYVVEIPSGTQVYDSDSFTLEINDNAESQYRLQNKRRGPWFIKFGTRETKFDVERDFNSRSEFDEFKSLTSKSIKVKTQLGSDTNRFFEAELSNVFIDDYNVALGGSPGDLIRGSVSYMGVYNNTASGAARNTYKISIGTGENLVLTVPPPSNFAKGTATSTTIPLTWDKLEITNTILGGFQIAWKLGSASSYNTNDVVDISDPNAVSGTITGLTSGASYKVRIKSTLADGVTSYSTPWSTELDVTTA